MAPDRIVATAAAGCMRYSAIPLHPSFDIWGILYLGIPCLTVKGTLGTVGKFLLN